MDIHDSLLLGLAPRGAPRSGERQPLTEADFGSYVTHSELFGPSPTWQLFFDRLPGSHRRAIPYARRWRKLSVSDVLLHRRRRSDRSR